MVYHPFSPFSMHAYFLENIKACFVRIFKNIKNIILMLYENYFCFLSLMFFCVLYVRI